MVTNMCRKVPAIGIFRWAPPLYESLCVHVSVCVSVFVPEIVRSSVPPLWVSPSPKSKWDTGTPVQWHTGTPRHWYTDVEIVVHLGILDTRKYFGSQKILTEITAILLWISL